MDGWDFALWSVAAYAAVLTLVRFMTARRGRVLTDLRDRAAVQAQRAASKDANDAGQPRV